MSKSRMIRVNFYLDQTMRRDLRRIARRQRRSEAEVIRNALRLLKRSGLDR